MRVRIRRLELTDFRNYESFVLEPSEGLTILLGPNAVGKTNLIEAIELVSEASSFRNPAWGDLVREGAERAVVVNRAESETGKHVDIALTIENGRRSYRVNGTAKRVVADAAGHVPAVVFTPDDLQIVKAGAERRRAVLDALGSQISRAYTKLKSEYDRVLRQRNALLKDAETTDLELSGWTELLARTGAVLTQKRKDLVARVAPHARAEYAALTGGEELAVQYVSSWSGESEQSEAAMLERLRERAAEERARRTSLVGPHRDDLRFTIAGRDARAFASQGQQRSAALAWKLAELETIEEITGITPVLLLDDVMSELDETRRHALAARVGQRTQTIITTTNLGYFDESLVAAAKLVKLS